MNAPKSVVNNGIHSDPMVFKRAGKPIIGLHLVEEFQNGFNYKPQGRVPVSGPTMRRFVGGSGSDMDLESDSDDDGHYSVESSPQDDKVHINLNRKHVCMSNGFVMEELGKTDKVQQACVPNFLASGLGRWCSVISYDACVRLCLNSWAKGSREAAFFLDNECAALRDAFSLRQVLLQSEDEILSQRPSGLVGERASLNPKKTMGKLKVQARKVKLGLDESPGCSFPNFPKVELESLKYRYSITRSRLSSEWEEAVQRVNAAPPVPKSGSLKSKSLGYVHIGSLYVKEVASLMKTGITTFSSSSSSYESVRETYSCSIRLKSSSEEDAVRIHPGSGESHIFFPDSLGDDLIVRIQDSKGKYCGYALVQVASVADDPSDKLRWWLIHHETGFEPVGRIQLHITYSTSSDDNGHLKCGTVAETIAYDLVLETAMKAQQLQQRNLLLHGQWKWLVTEFAFFYGVSDAYSKLRYLSYVMDVATPTADCLLLVHDLLLPVVRKGNSKDVLSHQENRILGEMFDKIENILALVFENYKSLDESLPSGLADVFVPATGLAAPVLTPAVRLFSLRHDILSCEAQMKLCRYFQAAAKKRSIRHLADTNDFVSGNNEGMAADGETVTAAYQKMKSLCLSMKLEIYTDIEIHNQNVLPSFLDLPNLTSPVYSTDLCTRLRAFLKACPPSSPSSHVADVVITAADFQRDLALWKINPIKGGVDAKELFDLYIINWIKDKRAALLELCKVGKVRSTAINDQQLTNPFVDDIYNKLMETLREYEIIICRWPEYAVVLENAIADVEKAVVEALERQHADVLSPLKEAKFGLKYVQKFAKRTETLCVIPAELGTVLNSMRKMLDILWPKIETQFKSWGTCLPEGSGNPVPGERLSEVTIALRAKFRNYLQAVTEKLVENTRLQNTTRWKKIIQDFKETSVDSDIKNRMQPLQDLITKSVHHLHSIFETHVFLVISRGFWDRIGQEVLNVLENTKENRSCYKGSRVALSIVDDTFVSQLQELLGNALQEKDLQPPRSILEAHSMLCKDSVSCKDYF